MIAEVRPTCVWRSGASVRASRVRASMHASMHGEGEGAGQRRTTISCVCVTSLRSRPCSAESVSTWYAIEACFSRLSVRGGHRGVGNGKAHV